MTAAASGATIYVDESGGGPYASPWNSPVTLAWAVQNAAVGDIIYIAQGIYSPGSSAPDHYLLKSGFTLEGGWDPATNMQTPDPTLTVIDGEYGSGVNDHNNNLFKIVGPTSEGAVTVRYLTIKNGYPHTAPGTVDPKYGAGIQVDGRNGQASLTVEHCIFEDNDANSNMGAGIGSESGTSANTIIVHDCVFRDNIDRAIGSLNNCNITITDSSFYRNTTSTDSGGAVHAPGTSTLTINGSWFEDNEAITLGGAVYATNVEINNSVFVNNTTTGGNSAGGAVGVRDWVEIDRCIFVGNHAARFGGAVKCDTGSRITNSLFNKNSVNFGSVDDGGAIYAEDGSTTPDIQIVNCTIVNNSAFSGAGGVWTDGEVHNCIIWNNTSVTGTEPNIFLDNTITPIRPLLLTYSDIQQIIPADWGTTNINSDPRFKDIDGADGILGNFDDDYRLLSVLNSPCIDAGSNPRIISANPSISPLLDLDGHGRFFDDSYIIDTGVGPVPIVDMGCYEMDDPCTGGCPGDLDRDGTVDVDDLNLVLSNWGTQVGQCGPGDANGDGVVNVDDLNLVLSNWGESCGGTGTQEQEQGQQQSLMANGEGDESDLPLDLQSLGFTTREEYRAYLETLTPTECFLHAFDVLEAHANICGGTSDE